MCVHSLAPVVLSSQLTVYNLHAVLISESFIPSVPDIAQDLHTTGSVVKSVPEKRATSPVEAVQLTVVIASPLVCQYLQPL